MLFTLLIQASPAQSDICLAALDFIRELKAQGHEIHCVFFYGDGVEITNLNREYPSGEPNIYLAWKDTIATYKLNAHICVAAASRRGLFSAEQVSRPENQHRSISVEAPFQVSGLGQLIEANILSDRLITFK